MGSQSLHFIWHFSSCVHDASYCHCFYYCCTLCLLLILIWFDLLVSRSSKWCYGTTWKALTYLQLVSEDYRWWWKSFLSGGYLKIIWRSSLLISCAKKKKSFVQINWFLCLCVCHIFLQISLGNERHTTRSIRPFASVFCLNFPLTFFFKSKKALSSLATCLWYA
jgi:hypothetical protein